MRRFTRHFQSSNFVSNASESTSLEEMLKAAFARWHVEMWFERAKQHCGFGAFEVRTYRSLIRHWLCSRISMYLLATETTHLREKKPEITLEQVVRALGPLLQRSLECDPDLIELLSNINDYHQKRNRSPTKADNAVQKH